MSKARADAGLIALIIGFAALAAAVMGTLLLFRGQQDAQRWVVHTLATKERLSAILSDLQDAETGQRGYLVTRDPAYLQPYDAGTRHLRGEIDALEVAVADNPRQRDAARQLRHFAEARIERLAMGVALMRAGEFERAAGIIREGVGKRLMDASRATIAAMKAREDRLLADRIAEARQRAQLLTLSLMASALAVAALAFLVTRDARRRAEEAALARDATEVANARLLEEAATREAAEAQLRQMHKMDSIGQLTGGVAHDFNNMLGIVIGSLDLAKRRLHTDLRRAEICIDNAVQGAERAAQLTSRLLAFSRQQPLAPSALDANRLVAGMSELLRRTIGENIRLETVLAGGLWPAFIDAPQLESALVNLCVNARDAMGEGGRLTIETANSCLDEHYAVENAEVVPGQYVMVSVTDTGSGMPAGVIERAFDPFYTTKSAGKGTGLGLSQVYGFVKQSRGHVKIYSEPGVGTTVKVYLPRHFGEAAAARVDDEPAALPRALDGEVVLVVEDEERVRGFAVEALSELGYAVIEAGNAAQALALLAGQPRVDLLFTDIVMPDMNGRLLADRAREALPALRILYTTGYTRNAIVHNGMLDPDVAFIAKPFTVAQLATKVRQVLES